MSLEDREFVEGVLAGSAVPFEQLVRKYNRMAGAIAYGIVGDFQLAEDVVQVAFLKAYRSLGSLRDPEKFKPWLAGIVRSGSLDALRVRKAQPIGDLVDGYSSGGRTPETPSVEEEQMGAESCRTILQAVTQLPKEDRIVFVLKHMEGLSYRKIADITGATVSSVESRLFRARRALRKKLNPKKT